MPCPLLLEPVEVWDYERRRPALLQNLPSMIAAARFRVKYQIIQPSMVQWGTRLRRIPLTSEEVKERVKQRYERDEAKILPLLCGRGSLSGTIFTRLRLTRGIIREVMNELSRSRVLQATFASIVCATRFKFFQGDSLLHTECGYCGQIDSFSHLISCVNIGEPPQGSADLVGYLAELADRAYNVNPGLPRPILEGGGAELELVPSEVSVTEEGSGV